MSLSVEVLEERINNIMSNNSKEHAAILQELEKMNSRVDAQLERINTRLDVQFVTRREFNTVRTIVFSAVGLISAAFIKGLLEVLLS